MQFLFEMGFSETVCMCATLHLLQQFFCLRLMRPDQSIYSQNDKITWIRLAVLAGMKPALIKTVET